MCYEATTDRCLKDYGRIDADSDWADSGGSLVARGEAVCDALKLIDKDYATTYYGAYMRRIGELHAEKAGAK